MTVFIAPPFGTWLRPLGAVPVLGSTTLLPRPGRAGQVLRTVRPVPGGWVNAVGLRNPGVASLRHLPGTVRSLAAIEDGDWERLLDAIAALGWPDHWIELNLSCPNGAHYGPPSRSVLMGFNELPLSTVIAKLPPDEARAMPLVDACLVAGIRNIHLSNTLPSPVGGISGDPLRRVNLPLVERVARVYPGADITAGGGIRLVDHARQYRDAGARHVSLGAVLFNPWRGLRLCERLVREGY